MPAALRGLIESSPHYLLGEDDHALPHPGAVFARRAGLTPTPVPGTHEGMLAHPDAIAEAILAA
jgi:hypothetical protein